MGFTNTNSKPKLKPARMITKEKVQEVKDKMADISSTVVSSQTVSAHTAESSEQVEDADVIVPVCQYIRVECFQCIPRIAQFHFGVILEFQYSDVFGITEFYRIYRSFRMRGSPASSVACRDKQD